MAYGVEWVEAPQVKPEHLAVWERNLALPVAARDRFDWLYRDNPAGPGRLVSLVARSGDEASRVVGTAGYGTRRVRVGSSARRAAVLADLAVDRAHRTAMPALMLARELRSDVLARYDLVYAFPNQQASPFLLRLGYRQLGETRRFVLPLRHERHLAGRTNPVVAWAAVMGLDIARAAIVAARAARPLIDYRLDRIVDADRRFDMLWEAASPEYQLIGVRDAAFIRWRFLDRPEGRLELYALSRRHSGVLEAYAVVARDVATAHVRDLFGHASALEPLLRLLCARLVGQFAESVSIRIAGAPALLAVLGTLGFRERVDRRSIVVDAGAALGNSTEIFDAARWYITDADEDA